jgi:hypothetical protein
MSDWVEGELAECQMHDVRHAKRLAQLLDRLSARPVGSIPTACHGWVVSPNPADNSSQLQSR